METSAIERHYLWLVVLFLLLLSSFGAPHRGVNILLSSTQGSFQLFKDDEYVKTCVWRKRRTKGMACKLRVVYVHEPHGDSRVKALWFPLGYAWRSKCMVWSFGGPCEAKLGAIEGGFNCSIWPSNDTNESGWKVSKSTSRSKRGLPNLCTSLWRTMVATREDYTPVSYTHLTLPTNREV